MIRASLGGEASGETSVDWSFCERSLPVDADTALLGASEHNAAGDHPDRHYGYNL
jgi:hypothetical protein